MRPSLAQWIGEADALWHLEHFRVSRDALDLAHIRNRAGDYYLSLVGDLFDCMRTDDADDKEWARLGNALSHFAAVEQNPLFPSAGVSKTEATLFSASAFYGGGFPASAYLTIRTQGLAEGETETYRACFDLPGRRTNMTSQLGAALLDALRRGNMDALAQMGVATAAAAAGALAIGPNEWIPARLLEKLVKRFLSTNVRAVLPEGDDAFWTPFVNSLIERTPSAWDFFPSQIQAIERGLLQRTETFSLQMPTGSGKTALCETLLYWHAKRTEAAVAVLLVPYRSLASELKERLSNA